MAFGRRMGSQNESSERGLREGPHAAPRQGASGRTEAEPVRRGSLVSLLAASGFAAVAAMVLAASIIFGLPGTEHAAGRGQVSGRVTLTAPALRR